MSRYEELIEAYESQEEARIAYEEEVRSFIWQLTKAFADHLGVEHKGGKMRFYPPDEDEGAEQAFQKKYNPTGGTRLMGDSFSHVGFVLLLGDDPEWSPIVNFRLLVKKQNGHFIVKNGERGRPTQITAREGMQQDREIKEFCAGLYGAVKENLATRFDRFISEGKEPEGIGFKIEAPDSKE